MLHDVSRPSARPRILVVVRWPVGGIRTWCKYVFRPPHFASFDIDLVMPDGHEASTLASDMAASGLHIKVLRTGPSLREFAARVVALAGGGRYSLVHSHGFTSAAICSLPCRVRGIPHLATVHEEILSEQYRDRRGRIVRWLLNQALARVDCVHAVSHASGENIRTAFPGAARCRLSIRVISNGIDSERFTRAEAAPLRQEIGIPDEALLVGFFGRFMAPKGFRYLVEAMSLLSACEKPSREVAVVAIGGGGFRREEEARVRELGLATRFHFLDFMPDISAAMKAVDVVVMPSLWEASGLLAMEALTSGVPIVVSRASGLVEVTSGTPAARVPIGDPQALLDAIIQMGAPGAKEKFREFSATAGQRFDVRRTRELVTALYGELIVSKHD